MQNLAQMEKRQKIRKKTIKQKKMMKEMKTKKLMRIHKQKVLEVLDDVQEQQNFKFTSKKKVLKRYRLFLKMLTFIKITKCARISKALIQLCQSCNVIFGHTNIS